MVTKSNPKHTDTSRSGDLVERLRERTCVVFNSPGVHPDTECLEAADRIEALEAENERLRKAMTAMHKDLLLRAEIDIRDGTKIVHASNGVWLKFCAALKEIKGD